MASAGGSSGSFAELFAQANRFWSLGAGIAQPIFAGGSLLHKQRAAEGLLEQARALYRSAVLTAFQNVADTLHALHDDADALGAAQAGRDSAAAGLAIAQRQYAQGQVAYPAVLAAEAALLTAQQALAAAQAQRFADTSALYQALGGGWDTPIAH